MAAAYQRELDFMVAVLRRMRLMVHLLHPQDTLEALDYGMRGVIGMSADYDAARRTALQWSQERTVYKVLDQFMCNYVYFHLPGMPEPTAVVIGPYLTIDPTRELLLEQTERLGLPMQSLAQQAEFYASLPVFNDPAAVMAVVTCFGETVWGGAEAFDMVDVNYEQNVSLPGSRPPDAPIEQDNILQQMEQMEARYDYENELMEIVSRGLTHRAEVMMSSVSQLNYQQRLADPLRNMKNYCIICNTLLRKAAQQGGVHPIHLDRVSGNYARMIENAPTLEKCSEMIGAMVRGYCRLVRTHTGKNYSAIVQRTLTYIESNISGDLSLRRLAELQQVTAGYLSAIFHRETGRTLGEHISEQRMKLAYQLLRNTKLQIQSIAQLCGMPDANYFSKVFKRHYQITPRRVRQEQMQPAEPDTSGRADDRRQTAAKMQESETEATI